MNELLKLIIISSYIEKCSCRNFCCPPPCCFLDKPPNGIPSYPPSYPPFPLPCPPQKPTSPKDIWDKPHFIDNNRGCCR